MSPLVDYSNNIVHLLPPKSSQRVKEFPKEELAVSNTVLDFLQTAARQKFAIVIKQVLNFNF